jgi:hypothetical protein
MTIAEPELIAELRACASLSTVLRSIEDALLERTHVTFPVASTVQVSLPDMVILLPRSQHELGGTSSDRGLFASVAKV